MSHLISILDAEGKLEAVFEMAADFKADLKEGRFQERLRHRTLAMIFEKSSTRTRVSFEVAMTQLGGHAIYLGAGEMQLKRGETIGDTARVLSRYVDGIMIRAYRHGDVVELGRHATVPVINGLTDLEHPCQVISDLFTIREKKGGFDGKLAYVGDGNNVCNSLLLGCAMVGMDISVGRPEGYGPDGGILEKAQEIAEKTGAAIAITEDPREAVKGADIIYTDVWVSMGQEAEKEERMRAFKPYQVNAELVSAADEPLIMHCLPAKRGYEITDEILDGPGSIVLDQAENRLHVQKAILAMLMGE
ncbi:MAG: ornithine carbamoyltransferase [Euryarchaeota archaeon]|nr:ornithine carbamoyltransferase [Euryarchaeota archaeon]